MERIIILSTNNNPDYYAYLPYQIKAWHSYGWKVCVLATHDCDHEAITGYGADFTVFLPAFDGIRPETVAQASRLYAANYLPEDALLMTCDMDLIPTSDYWHPEPANITVYGHDLTDYSYIPMGYVAMTGKKWKEVFQLTGDTAADMQRDFALYADMVKSPDWGVYWNYDWRLLTDRLKPFDIKHVIRGRRISGTYAYGRIDRGDSMQVPPNETLIDMHCENNNTQHPDKLNRFLELYEMVHGKRANEKVETAKKLIKELYEECPVGGYGHIVFDDYNVEDGDVDWCISEAEKGGYDFIEESGRLKSISALRHFRTLTEDERYEALGVEPYEQDE